jgi:hypothetical protein
MMLLGRYSRLIFDSWTRPTYAKVTGARKAVADRTIERRVRRYGRTPASRSGSSSRGSWVAEGREAERASAPA